MSLNEKEIAKLLEVQATAISTITVANIEKLIYDLKGTETPEDSYACGYRDALDTMLLKLRRLNAALAMRQPEATNE